MEIDEFLYRIGVAVEKIIRAILAPTPSEKPPKLLVSFIKSKKFTVHEIVSLYLQLCFIAYLIASSLIVFFSSSPLYVIVLSLFYFAYLRYLFLKYSNFLIDDKPYKVFYYGISLISFFSFLGYSVLRSMSPKIIVYYVYIILVGMVVLMFRWYFRAKYGREYTYGTVEEVKNGLVKVFVNDDIAANVKPGYYWLPEVPGIKMGAVVKLLVENRTLRSARPIRILEVLSDKKENNSKDVS
ncbi:hypothetical protein PNA2_1874 [Pyrococcus sp. NA2]|uniref:DUF2101 family protein n=1 Tax=Pyrococcus sp. (strain NA2) TaxID=342949 RepID=UPI000209ACE6|nr:DUF2101 family protein [Pyrococcus sp. NA2]AEC52788.1 hypothetical protein PNA2_1874 [Pyrococcus sp. NA2]